tara:strand:- start:453 stop:620 length:168 start_codon:yes stop_codon:yes gene_type:complete
MGKKLLCPGVKGAGDRKGREGGHLLAKDLRTDPSSQSDGNSQERKPAGFLEEITQ